MHKTFPLWFSVLATSVVPLCLCAEEAKKAEGTTAATPGRLDPEKAFSRFDRNQDGFVVADELPPGAAAILERADKNGDKKLDQAEFAAAMKEAGPMFGAGPRGLNTWGRGGRGPGGGPGWGAGPAGRGVARMQGAPGRGPFAGGAPRAGQAAGPAGPPAKPGSGPGFPPPPHGAWGAQAWGGGWQGPSPHVPGPRSWQVAPPLFRPRGWGWGGVPAWGLQAHPAGRGYRQPWGPGRGYPGFRMFWGDREKTPSPKDLFKRADKDKDGKLSLDEFTAGLQQLHRAARAHRAPGPGWPLPARRGGWPGKRPEAAKPIAPPPEKKMFKDLDGNQDGKLSKEEIPEHMRAKLGKMDANQDGFITLEEWRQAPKAMPKPKQAGGKPDKKPPAEKQPPGKPEEKKKV